MASACVNNIGVSPENFLDSSFSWFSPRISFSRDDSKISKPSSSATAGKLSDKKEDLETSSAGDFEFRLDDPAVMLPADELFSDGKLMPLQLKPTPSAVVSEEVRVPETAKSFRRSDAELSFTNDPYLFSPKAPRCSSRWRELLGLKKLYQSNKQENSKTPSSSSTPSTAKSSIRLFLYRNSKTTSSSTSDPSLSLPLLNNSDFDSLSLSSNRLSLSSSTSSIHDDINLPRHSIDSPNPNPTRLRPIRSSRVGRSPVRRAQPDPTRIARGVSVDSPRMNSSGRVLFQSLERSSSSPSSFNGGRPRYNNYRGTMERSYSANVVRVTPVLNVPVCSIRGLFSSSTSQNQKKDGSSSSNHGGNGSGVSSKSHSHHHHQQQNGGSKIKKEIL